MKKYKFYKYNKNNAGVAAVEFALLAPFLILSLIGIFDYGNFINSRMKLENTARAAADYIVQGGNVDSIADDVIILSNMDITDETIDDVEMTANFICSCGDSVEFVCDTVECEDDEYERRFIDISLTKNYTPVIPYPGITESIELVGNVRMGMID